MYPLYTFCKIFLKQTIVKKFDVLVITTSNMYPIGMFLTWFLLRKQIFHANAYVICVAKLYATESPSNYFGKCVSVMFKHLDSGSTATVFQRFIS